MSTPVALRTSGYAAADRRSRRARTSEAMATRDGTVSPSATFALVAARTSRAA